MSRNVWLAGQECGFAHVAGLVEWHHTCVRIYLRSFAGKHTLHTHTRLAHTPPFVPSSSLYFSVSMCLCLICCRKPQERPRLLAAQAPGVCVFSCNLVILYGAPIHYKCALKGTVTIRPRHSHHPEYMAAVQVM